MTLLVLGLRVCHDEAGHLSLAMLAGMVTVEAMPLVPFQRGRVMDEDHFLKVLGQDDFLSKNLQKMAQGNVLNLFRRDLAHGFMSVVRMNLL